MGCIFSKTNDVSGQEASVSALGPQYDNITIIQSSTTDASTNTSSNTNAQTTVSTGFGGGMNRNKSGYKASTATSPFAGRYP